MKNKYFYFALLLLLPMLSFAQPVVRHAEDFPIGSQLFFRTHSAKGISMGAPGANQTWDYSSNTTWEDSSTEWMVAPSSIKNGKDFPQATLVEKYSDGSLVYVKSTPSNSNLLAYVDTTQALTIRYPNPVLFSRRPITYGDKIIDTFTTNAKGPGFSYTGQGTSVLQADGYGTLKVGGETYNNILRIRIYQRELDTMGGSPFAVTNVSNVWFDTIHASALLKIDSNSQGIKMSYLVSETMSGIEDAGQAISIKLKANISDNTLSFFGKLQSGKTYSLNLFNSAGQNVYSIKYLATEGEEHQCKLPANLDNGIYILNLRGNNEIGNVKVLKRE